MWYGESMVISKRMNKEKVHNFNTKKKIIKSISRIIFSGKLLQKTQKAKRHMLKWEGRVQPNISMYMLLPIENHTT